MDKKGRIALGVGLLIAVVLVATLVMAGKPPAAACNNGVDDDGDGYTDLADPGCTDKRDTSELNLAIECDDGSDNDGDSSTDMSDSGCTSPTDTDETNCGDGVCEGGETYGVCVADCGPANSCSDSDGYNVEVLGTVSGYSYGNAYALDDFCSTGTYLIADLFEGRKCYD